MSDRVVIENTNGVAQVWLNRPDKRNALDGEMFQAIADAGEQLKSDAELRAVVIAGRGQVVLCRPRSGDVRAARSGHRGRGIQGPSNRAA